MRQHEQEIGGFFATTGLTQTLGVIDMSVNVSLLLLSKAAAPSLVLFAIGVPWFCLKRTSRAIPATLIGIGIALLSGMIVIVAGYSFPNIPALKQSMILLMGFPFLIYAVTLILFFRYTDISKTAAAVCGAIGIIPLYLLGGYVAINSACSFGTGGC